jgi:phage shock protein A
MSVVPEDVELDAAAAPVLCAVLNYLRERQRAKLSTERQIEELRESCDRLEKRVGELQEQINVLQLRLAASNMTKDACTGATKNT